MGAPAGGQVRFDGGQGTVGTHPPQTIHPALVAPSTSPEEYNRIEEDLTPIACVRINDSNFAFESSFIEADVSTELRDVAVLREDTPGMRASIFGHADPTGSEEYNKKLSGRRAQAVYALLTRRTDLWEDLYKNPLPGHDGAHDVWGPRALQTMLQELGHHPGPITDHADDGMQAAVEKFQAHAGLTVDGTAGRDTRPALYLAYMNHICVDLYGKPFRLDAQAEFIAAGSAAGGKGDFQGCGEANPTLILPQAVQEGEKTARDVANLPNRRVLIFFFRPGTRVDPARWPCATVSDPAALCAKRFFSDHRDRRAAGDAARKYADAGYTLGCRFYDRFARRSPCEGPRPTAVAHVATWDRSAVSSGDVAQMILTATDLPAGQVVTFRVYANGRIPIGRPVTAIAEAGRASQEWGAWFDRQQVTHAVRLNAHDAFPRVSFHFVASYSGRSTSSALITYSDTIRIQLTWQVAGQREPMVDTPYTVHSPFGTRTGVTKRQEGSDGWLVERDVPPGGTTIVISGGHIVYQHGAKGS